MKRHVLPTMVAIVASLLYPGMPQLVAEVIPDAASAVSAEPRDAPKQKTRHQKLCELLGLQPGRTYVFRIANSEDVHYWTVVSLGAQGWIEAKDSLAAKTWVNLSEVISITPFPVHSPSERPLKANRRNALETGR